MVMPGAGSVVGVAKASWIGPRAITSTPLGTSWLQAGRDIDSPPTIIINDHLGKRACMIVISRNKNLGIATWCGFCELGPGAGRQTWPSQGIKAITGQPK